MDLQDLKHLYRAMYAARCVDRVERELTNRGEAFFHVSGAGHESSACLALHLNEHDWLHCHYRDKALMLARGLTAKDFFDASLCKDASHSRGRQMSAHMSSPELHLLSIVGPVGNSALQAAGVAAAVREREGSPVVLCSVGDGTSQQGEFLEACAEAVRSTLPVLFFVEDNRYAISTQTRGNTFYSRPDGDADEFYGMPIHRVDGRDVVAVNQVVGDVVAQMRQDRRPVVIVLDVERLDNHTNADDQTQYREQEEILAAADGSDPLFNFRSHLLQQGLSEEELAAIEKSVQKEVRQAEEDAIAGPEPAPIFDAKKAISVELTHPSRENHGEGAPALTMREALREVLRNHLQDDARVSLFGQDIEDPKGDVFGVTKGLTTQFGARVKNAPLTESTILGFSIGRALAGERPVAFLQFADFMPLAYNQIVSEMASMHWRSDGGWSSPVIVMAACGGLRPGLGPFHAQSFESLLTHTPGVDVFMPSTASDAAGLLNAAFASERPTLFLYPKSLLNDPANRTPALVADQFTPIGPARKVRSGRDVTFVSWGNTIKLCEKAAQALEAVGVESEILDLRTLSPWDEHAVIASAEKTAHLVVVHEDNHTCGLGAEISATVAEKTRVPVAIRRVTRPDTFVPCNFANQLEVLPSFRRVLTTAAELLSLDLSWIAPPVPEAGSAMIEAIGSGPADESVLVVDLLVKSGARVERGDAVASLEATKSVFEITSPVSGMLEEILVSEGDTVAVGAPLMRVRLPAAERRIKPVTQELPGEPVLTRKPSRERLRVPRRTTEIRQFEVGVSSIAALEGSRTIGNEELLALLGNSGQMTAEDIVRRTGIESRQWINTQEDAIGMAVKASWEALDRENLIPDDLDLVICTTTSPNSVTPSMACQVLAGLSRGKTSGAMLQAFDINAACSGYLYALQSGYDYLQSKPDGKVLIVTAEVLSPLLDPNDFDTAILFGDAASASILYGEGCMSHAQGKLFRPELSAKGDSGSALTVPLLREGYIQMHGRKVFSEAVRTMVGSLTRVCGREGMGVEALNLVVPHQANQRIMNAIGNRIQTEVFSNIRTHGNTSSSSIPLCLADVLPASKKGDRLGLCAFGGGFTFGAGILEAL
ncbi:thiamine pyrophosphate-dependent enzyme [Lignipirellula cremea]|uniref:3-methyl-2-oxobutanoate dehydrogenase (2-methylpropanoyl-transferring) n=1 Tax=Lignipirellula cremea TaxID=2528010 RepID=A0A518DWY2_9BACT|nr:thiamine pyrophosphate-dependent enzyme [Lignipirellula cremea]QDU96348.1 2-oxoisovalerate dehydrogenase subunit beta [Lignipirellula cremea]